MPTVLASAVRAVTAAEVRAVVATFLKVDPRDLDVSRSFASYGLDSLTAMHLIAELEDAFDRPLPEWLLVEHPSLGTLIDALSGGGGMAGAEVALMRADCHLPDDIRPCGGALAPSTRHVLVTGATGFLGAFLVRSLLQETTARITCLVRPARGDGARRLHDSLAKYGVWHEPHEARLAVVEGDLTAGDLGVSAGEYLQLANSIDAIYHAAADVNWVSSYTTLRAANVVGTRELLRLACAVRPKRFHFISSVSVCFPIGGPRWLDEAHDSSTCLEQLPLGYAQSKCVAEALVREATGRGLPTRIYRSALLAGDAVTGRSNLDDLIARLLKGCIEMGAAPDLDWSFDALPVDYAARAIVRVGESSPADGETLHLLHPQPRHWRDCVLWANVFGYRMTLEPFAEWRLRLARESSRPTHPLHGLRPFFLRRVGDRSVAEHYEQKRRSQVGQATSRRSLCSVGCGDAPKIDAHLLDRCVRDYIAHGFLPDRQTPRRSGSAPSPTAFLEPALRQHYGDDELTVRSTQRVGSGAEGSILGELVSWRQGSSIGVFHYDVELQGACPTRLAVTVKAKSSDETAIEVAATTAATCDRRLGELVTEFREFIGLRHAHLRELALYTSASERFKAYLPRCYGAWRRPDGHSWGLVLERLDGMALIDASDSTHCWTDDHIASAIDGLAELHSVWLGRTSELLTAPWIGHVPSTSSMQRMTELWAALADHAAPRFGEAAGSTVVRRHRQLAATVAHWWPALEQQPQTLIHNDFNSRNVGIRRTDAGLRLVAFDWELATIAAPQRDLAEFLCFVLPPTVSAATVARWVERHRARLERLGGRVLPARRWDGGFASALADFLITRLSFYAVIDRIRPQPFLTRIVRTWNQLAEHCEVDVSTSTCAPPSTISTSATC